MSIKCTVVLEFVFQSGQWAVIRIWAFIRINITSMSN